MNTDNENPFGWGEPISSYSRADAIADGMLVDVTKMAREAGYKFPVAMTRTVYVKYVEVPPGVECQDEEGRLWDILSMCALAMKRAAGSELLFKLGVKNDNSEDEASEVTLKAICSPGDTPEPVITIMLPEED